MGTVKGLVYLLVLLHFSIIRTAESCLLSTGTVRKSIWYSKNYKRNDLYHDCMCGELPESGELPLDWYVDIEVSFGRDDMKTHVYCRGTIVTSNLIATSHRCLMKPQSRLYAYDTWRPRLSKSNLARLQDIKVTYKAGPGRGTAFELPLKKIIVNPHFAISSAYDNFPDQDIALLVVEDNTWFSDAILGNAFRMCLIDPNSCNNPPASICIPTEGDANKLLYRRAYSVGTGDGARRELRSSGGSFILPGTDCDRERNARQVSNSDTVCLKTAALPPDMPGGPLIVNSDDSNKTAFLAGMTSWVGEGEVIPVQGLKYLYFSHISPLVKYIEWHAEKERSGWCKTPEFKVPDLVLPKNLSEEVDRGWEKPDRYKRDDSLDCVCGRKGHAQGRIIGGDEAVPHEFPWMVLFPGIRPSEGRCGGTIINDRMILSAAHCFLYDDGEIFLPDSLLAFPGSHNYDSPEGAEVRVSRVLVHPDHFNVSDSHYMGSGDFDIALLILEKPLKFKKIDEPQPDNTVVPICLPAPGRRMKIIGQGGMSAGWGRNFTATKKGERHQYAKNLKKVKVPVLPLGECKKAGANGLYETKICGTVKNDTEVGNTAAGDSGGPLMIQRDGTSFQGETIKHWVQVGIVSFDLSTFGIYTDLQTLMPFVDYHAQKFGAKWCKYEPDSESASSSASAPPQQGSGGGSESEASTDSTR